MPGKKKNNLEELVRSFYIRSDGNVVETREYGRKLAAKIGFSKTDQTLIATAISEICRNIIEYAGSGDITIEFKNNKNRRGIIITAKDEGPGIEDVERACQEGYSTGRGMGVGLSGSKRIMDEFDIQSERGKGTTINMSKWISEDEY